jgi:hypothetical protein
MTYDLEITVTDRSSNPTELPTMVAAITTEPFLRDKGNHEFKETGQTVIVDSIVWTGSDPVVELDGTTTLTAGAEVHVRYKFDIEDLSAMPSALADPSADLRVVVASVLARNKQSGATRVVDAITFPPPSGLQPSTYIADQVFTSGPGGTNQHELIGSGGPYLLAFETGSTSPPYATGTTKFEFIASGIAACEDVVLNIENVLPLGSPHGPGLYRTALAGTVTPPGVPPLDIVIQVPNPNAAVHRWSFPDSPSPASTWVNPESCPP